MKNAIFLEAHLGLFPTPFLTTQGVLCVDICNITPENGVSESMTQPNGEIVNSQSVKLYKASIVLSGEIPL